MRKIGPAPPRDRRTDILKAKIYEERFNQAYKAPVPEMVIADQLGSMGDHEGYYMPLDYECVRCRKEYIPVVCEPGDWGRYKRPDGTEYLLCNECKGAEG